ncbi:MAG: TIGR02587 family membrane protein [Hydrococcus sp. Prado102]|jgi:putative integral membrane protein (TIGR02587 family)|nr:TIGR02587 family membrane protein [Hydrococcus sp. Prado102]
MNDKNSTHLNPTRSAWRNEVYDLIRGASGGFLFGIPLIYTMEVWWIGSYTEPPLMLAVLATTYIIVFLLNRTDGFRQMNPDDSSRAARDSIEALAISLICTTLILILLREITLETSLKESLGKIIFEAVPFAIGVALARSIMSGTNGKNGQNSHDSNNQKQPKKKSTRNHLLSDIGATLIGAMFIAFNIAPTDEVPMLSAAVTAPWLLGVVAASLVISYGIVFAAGFTTQEARIQHQGLFQRPFEETILSYFVSLVSAAAMLWFFHRLDFTDPWTLWLSQTILLGFPATIGGAAGRLAV